MSLPPFEVNLELTDQKVNFKAVSKLHPENPVSFDYPPPLGEGDGYLGLEMLVMTFSSSVNTGIVALLRRTGKNILGYKMNVQGYRREQPLSLEKIHFEVIVESSDLSDEEVKNTIKTAEQISPVWMAIQNNVQVIPEFRIIRPE